MSEHKSLTPQLHGVDEELPQRITNDELYRRSTQYRYWSFTQNELTDLRVRVNKKGEQTFRNRINSLSDDVDIHLQIKKYVSQEFTPLTPSEELEIVIYYARKCHDLSNFFKFTTQVRLTAVSYLLKFYLIHSVMEYYPQQIMYTCLFLAAKSENNFLGINAFSHAIPKTTPATILEHEYRVLDTMRFSLMCHHPMRPLYGFYLDVQQVLVKLDFGRLCKDYENARRCVNDSVFSDAQFLYTPSQIALAALYLVDDVVCMRYLMRKFGIKKKQMVAMMEEREREKETGDAGEDGAVKTEDGVPATAAAADDDVGDKVGTADSADATSTAGTAGTTDTAETAETAGTIATPLERFNKVMECVKRCAVTMQKTRDPSVQTAKAISLKAHFCLDPVKYFRKIHKDSPTSETPLEVSSTPDAGVKRELTDSDGSDAKRVKL